jgi:predicted 2-oxoglutarate/Fe(II)-dependent dioxygenase YbiX
MSLIQNKDFKFSIQIPTFLSHEKCDELIEQITTTEQVVTGSVGAGLKETEIIPEIRVTEEWYLFDQPYNKCRPDKCNGDWKWLQDKIYQVVKLVNQGVFHFDVEGVDDELKLIKYHQGGFYSWHTDFNAGDSSLRKLTAIVQLTDPSEYEGGDVQFGIQDKHTKEWYTINKLKGSLTIFPTFLSHRVTPVTKGTRYVLQEFYTGNHFK